VVLRPWLCEADGLADDLQELQGNARPFAQLAEGRAADPGEPIESRHIQEGKGESSIPDGYGHAVERHAGPLQSSAPNAP